jgi:selenide, water dikinase
MALSARSTASDIKDLVLIGGGHTHVSVLKGFGIRPQPGVRLTLITRDINTPYSGMLPGFVAGHYTHAECHIDLMPLAAFAGANIFHAEAIGIDRPNRRVLLANRPAVAYDVLSIDIGSRPRQHDVPGSAEHATPVKPIDRFVRHWAALVDRIMRPTGLIRVGVIGAGAGGVELILAVQHRLRTLLLQAGQSTERLHFAIVSAERLLPTHNARVRKKFQRILAERGIAVHIDHEVVRVEPGRIVCRDGATLAIDEILWVTQASTASWLADAGLACDPDGFVRVRDTLQTVTDPLVFATGDCAAVDPHPRPKAGVFAVRQGPPLTENLRLVLSGRTPRPFTPQRKFLSLISTGDQYAIASRGAWAAEGKWLWTLKDRIDRRFMRKFSVLPDHR